MNIDLSALGISPDELADRVVQKVADTLLNDIHIDPGGNEEWRTKSPLANKLDALIKARIDSTINQIADAHVLPNVAAMIEGITLQQTNSWGEKRGTPMSFTEYLVDRATVYMTEPVNFEGKTKEECAGYSWASKQTRIVHLIDKHLQHSISVSMTDALKSLNAAITGGIQETVKLQLAELSKKLTVAFK